MNSKSKLNRVTRQALACGFVATSLLLGATGLQAAALWDNGVGANSGGTSGFCDGGPLTCGNNGSQSYTIFDNFTVGPSGWAVTGFDFTDYFVNGTLTSAYTASSGTSWSLWKGDPLGGGTLVASGTQLASLTNLGGCGIGCLKDEFSITLGSSILLTGGTYYLGTSNSLTAGARTERDFGSASGANYNTLPGWEQSQGSIVVGNPSTWTSTQSNVQTSNDTSFDIQGTLAPEPGTLAVMGIALAGLFAARRRRMA